MIYRTPDAFAYSLHSHLGTHLPHYHDIAGLHLRSNRGCLSKKELLSALTFNDHWWPQRIPSFATLLQNVYNTSE